MPGHIQPPISGSRPIDLGSNQAAASHLAPAASGSSIKDSRDPNSDRVRSRHSRRGASRISLLLIQLVLLAGGLWSFGCDNCEERFCKGVQVVTANMMNLASDCCDNPGSPDCEGLDERFSELLESLHDAYEACLDGNTQRMRELLEFIIRVLPRVLLIPICGEEVDLGDWFAEACHPYVNSSTVFLASDRITAHVGLKPATGSVVFSTRGGLAQHPSANEGVGGGADFGQTHYRFTKESSIEVDAWWGSQQFAVEGSLGLAPAMIDPAGTRTHQVSDLVLELFDESGRYAGRVAFNGPSAPGFVRCTPGGQGMLGASVRIEALLGGVFSPQLANHSGTVWMELPITLSARSGVLGSASEVSAQRVFPVDPEFADRMEALPWLEWPFDGALQDGGSDVELCERVLGLTNREWRWLALMKQCFPQCFPGG